MIDEYPLSSYSFIIMDFGDPEPIKLNNMNYTEMKKAITLGNKVKLPEWIGYWFLDPADNLIKVMTATGDVLTTPFFGDYTNRTDWEITDGRRDFGGALKALKAGKKVALPHWGVDVSINLQITDAHSKMTHNYLYVTSRFGLVPWNPTQPELLSESWLIVGS